MRSEVAQIIRQDKVMELSFGNNACPKEILGRHIVRDGQVISAFHPEAVSMTVIDDTGKRYPMDPVERSNLYATFVHSLRSFTYQIEMVFRDGNRFVCEDPYSFPSLITAEEEEMICHGNWMNCYEKLGAHPAKIHGVEGVYFAVWAPHARRVSVVGDFNFWNGMMYPMQRLSTSGIFELFIPRIKVKALYRYEIKTDKGEIHQKVDPFGGVNLDGQGDASIVLDLKEYIWTDQQWMRDRHRKDWVNEPFAVCDREFLDRYQEEFLNYKCFTHVLLKTPAFCHGMRGKLREWINGLHRKGIGVILDISLGFFSCKENELMYFDGTSLYGHADERIHFDQERQEYRFDHGKKEVVSYLLANLIFWMREYHVDGFLLEGITEMVNASYERKIDQQTEMGVLFQKETKDFLCQAVHMIKKEDKSVIVIADETREAEAHNMHLLYSQAPFDMLLNYSVPKHMERYLLSAAKHRDVDQCQLTHPMLKNGMRNTVLNIALQDTIHFDRQFLNQEFLNEYDKYSWQKLTMGYLMGAPGKKRWSWRQMESAPIQNYLKKLFQIYVSYHCMATRGRHTPSFAWINPLDSKHRILSFVRRSPGGGKNLLFLCNFSRKKREGYFVGVPKYGEYRLLLNSDWEEFGGASRSYEDVVQYAKPQEWDLQPYSLRVRIAGLSVLIFEYD